MVGELGSIDMAVAAEVKERTPPVCGGVVLCITVSAARPSVNRGPIDRHAVV
jgi:hypothetical protein